VEPRKNLRGAQAQTLIRVEMHAAPQVHAHVIKQQLRFGEKGGEALRQAELLGRRTRIGCSAAAPTVQFGSFGLQRSNERHHGSHRYSFRPKAADERVVNVDVDDRYGFGAHWKKKGTGYFCYMSVTVTSRNSIAPQFFFFFEVCIMEGG